MSLSQMLAIQLVMKKEMDSVPNHNRFSQASGGRVMILNMLERIRLLLSHSSDSTLFFGSE